MKNVIVSICLHKDIKLNKVIHYLIYNSINIQSLTPQRIKCINMDCTDSGSLESALYGATHKNITS